MNRSSTTLPRAMAPSGPVEWAGATWCGALDVAALDHADGLTLGGWAGEARARLLVRDEAAVVGFVSVPVADGRIRAADVRAALASLPPADTVDAAAHPSITVVLCTHDRPELLRTALTSLLALDYDDFDVVVVDNAPSDDGTERAVLEFCDPRIRRVVEPVAGLARARNTGLAAATGSVVAFTDDDVVVDPRWLQGIATGFAQGADVGCVSGLVPSGELRTPAQAYFDQRVTWSDTVRRHVYRRATPPAGVPLFPFQVGLYGTGANFALRRDCSTGLGGFDEALGVGTRTGGGEDLDIFTRVLLAGWALVVEPTAVVWHRHRADRAALEHQARGYGRGLGAWLAKVLTSPQSRGPALRRAAGAVGRLARVGAGSTSAAEHAGVDSGLSQEFRAELGRLELRALLGGPAAFVRERLDGARAHPLARGRRQR